MKAGVRIGYRYETGEVLFKDFGVSGIAAFNLSSEIARGRAKIGDMLTIDFMPEYSKAEVEDILTKRNNNGTVAELLLGTFHSKVQERIIRAAGCDANDPAQSKIGAIANAIKTTNSPSKVLATHPLRKQCREVWIRANSTTILCRSKSKTHTRRAKLSISTATRADTICNGRFQAQKPLQARYSKTDFDTNGILSMQNI